MKASGNTLTISREEYQQLLQFKEEVVLLKHQLAELRRMIFGAKSERFISTDTNQMTLFDLPEQQTKPQEKEQITYTRNKSDKNKKQPLRLELAPHLPRKEEIIEPENIPGNAKIKYSPFFRPRIGFS